VHFFSRWMSPCFCGEKQGGRTAGNVSNVAMRMKWRLASMSDLRCHVFHATSLRREEQDRGTAERGSTFRPQT
jgi:hypothetical protein